HTCQTTVASADPSSGTLSALRFSCHNAATRRSCFRGALAGGLPGRGRGAMSKLTLRLTPKFRIGSLRWGPRTSELRPPVGQRPANELSAPKAVFHRDPSL